MDFLQGANLDDGIIASRDGRGLNVREMLDMTKIVYIASLGHSGSTVLDMSLGCHPKMVGLGEVRRVLEATDSQLRSLEFTKIVCSCGESMERCDFWSGVRDWMLQNSDRNMNEKYHFLLGYFAEKYGDDVVLVDSSKRRLEYLLFLNESHDLYVISLVRDFRSWIYSRYSRHKINMLKLAALWIIGNVETKKYLARNNLKSVNVGYEELSLYPEILLDKICAFIGLPFDKQMLEPGKTGSHIIRGNVTRGDEEKTKRFFYDARWLVSTKLTVLGVLLFPLMRWNRKNVYGNFVTGNTRAYGVSQTDFVLFGDQRKEDIVFKLDEFEQQYSKDKRWAKKMEKSSRDGGPV